MCVCVCVYGHTQKNRRETVASLLREVPVFFVVAVERDVLFWVGGASRVAHPDVVAAVGQHESFNASQIMDEESNARPTRDHPLVRY